MPLQQKESQDLTFLAPETSRLDVSPPCKQCAEIRPQDGFRKLALEIGHCRFVQGRQSLPNIPIIVTIRLVVVCGGL